MPSKLKAFIPIQRSLRKGDVDLCFQSGECYEVIQGEVQVAGQEHFYLETHCTLIWTVDGGNEVHMLSSTQRIGGGFGGKEARLAFVAAVASVPSYLLKNMKRMDTGYALE
ncbi:hypothetical protein EUGRSUZ_L00273 [Eucalyptus grandis]|uniref:Uncharacterized protein n=2 Tax=Eucalyptus grandis TaxID=71139 RepID=A0ACC3LD14_EUCGR|nr:hypothetical protein EUGRSUZ_L00273 [Eucalyptus grandis]